MVKTTDAVSRCQHERNRVLDVAAFEGLVVNAQIHQTAVWMRGAYRQVLSFRGI